MADRREVLPISYPGNQDTHSTAEKDIERMMTGIHDTRHRYTGRDKSWDENNQCSPNLSSIVKDMELSC